MKRSFISGVPVHCYQKGVDGNMLFYTQKDRLFYLTTYAVQAKKFGIETLALSLMFNHTHSLLRAPDLETLSLFNATTQQMYARGQNTYCGGTGKWFMKTFGWAQKKRDKDIRSCYCYINNNAVEKHLYKTAVMDRWNLIAFHTDNHPFSCPIQMGTISKALRSAIRTARFYHQQNQIINLRVLDYMTKSLSKEECNMLTDFIISLYCPINYKEAERYFGSIQNMISACDVNTGSEYDIKELSDGYTDRPYLQMLKSMNSRNWDLSHKQFLLDNTGILQTIQYLMKETDAPASMIARFLHRRIRTGPTREELPFLSEPLSD